MVVAPAFVPHGAPLVRSVAASRSPQIVDLDPALAVAPIAAALPPADALSILAQSVAMQAGGPQVAALVAAGLYVQPALAAAQPPPVEAYDATLVGLLECLFLFGLVATFTLSQQVLLPTLDALAGDSPWSRVNPSPVVTDQLSSPAISWKALPTWEELVDACHVVAEGAAGPIFLCAEATNDTCTPADEFSAKYGRPVYLCTI
jgi:hypothetical protein